MAKYWRSLEELYEKPAFRDYIQREFPEAASMIPEGVSRRRWLQVMGASLAMAGVTGCRWEDEKIATYANRPVNRIPGVPVKYATMLERSGVAFGVLVTSYDGRPIKVDVNSDHPQQFSGTDLRAQGSILQVYDPDRIARDPKTGKQFQLYDPLVETVLREKTGETRAARTWEQFDQFVEVWLKTAKTNGGAGVRFLAGANSSPTLMRLRQELQSVLPQAQWVEYEPLTRDNEMTAAKLAFGNPTRVRYDLNSAQVVVGLDSDLFDFHPDALRHIREWADHRVPENGDLNRTYAVEACYSALGQNADHRLALASSQIGSFVVDLIDLVHGAISGSAKINQPEEGNSKQKFIASLADDLVNHQGQSVVVAGPRQPVEVQAACLKLNQMLGNLGKTVLAIPEFSPSRPQHLAAVTQLTAEMTAGKVDTLVIVGGNPAYDVPASIGFVEAVNKVSTTIRLGQYDDETAAVSQWYLPEAHDFEAWGDGRSYDGTITLKQPLLTPLHRGISAIELLSKLLQLNVDAQSLVKQTIAQLLPNLGENGWQKAIHDGFIADSAPANSTTIALDANLDGVLNRWMESVSAASREAAASSEYVILPDESVYDGRDANNAWLQETPGSLTKLTWDNVAVISPRTAAELGLKDGDVVKLQVVGQSIEIPVFQLPGIADNTFGMTAGYGRKLAGLVGGSLVDGVEPVGVNPLDLLSVEQSACYGPATVTVVGKQHLLATTQNHWAIDLAGMKEIGRRFGSLIREGTVSEYKEHADFAQHRVHHPELESLWVEKDYAGDYQWGMSIDLARCTGCNACVTACQSENNIPVVGKDQVNKNREMHWIRVDRYFVGEAAGSMTAALESEGLGVAVQPVTCMQCENAPCEQVCPVAATVHSKEGLNDMVYNRCIGTRYCANNCPYKVRRFNYFSHAKPLMKPEKELVQLVLNPEVTVRSRGVMEKCTYCVQRIMNGKIVAKNERRQLADGEVKTACQEACPTNAIVFGNLKDKTTEVYGKQHLPRSYGMLAELNVKPRTEYLARIRNPHPWLEASYYLQPGEHHGSHGEDGHSEDGHDDAQGSDHHDDEPHGHDHDHDHDHDDKATST